MHSRVYLISGIALLISGFMIFMNSAQTLTGFAIMEDVDLNTGYLAGIWLIAAGIVLLIIGRHEDNRNYNNRKHDREAAYHGKNSPKRQRRLNEQAEAELDRIRDYHDDFR